MKDSLIRHFVFTHNAMNFRIRPIIPEDKNYLQAGFRQLSDRSKYLRFFQFNSSLSDAQLNYFTELDDEQHVALGILDETGDEAVPVAIGRFVRFTDEQDVAEVAITVVDAYQRKGLGRLLFTALNIIAGQMGITKLRYYVLRENRFVLNALKKFGVLNKTIDGYLTIVDIAVIPNHKSFPNEPEMQQFVASMKRIEEKMGL